MPVILSDDTYQRLIKMLEKWEKGDIIQPGNQLKTEESGTGYQKLGVNPSNAANTTSSSLTVSDGTNTVNSVSRMNFIGTLFSITSPNSTTANIGLRTETCN